MTAHALGCISMPCIAVSVSNATSLFGITCGIASIIFDEFIFVLIVVALGVASQFHQLDSFFCAAS